MEINSEIGLDQIFEPLHDVEEGGEESEEIQEFDSGCDFESDESICSKQDSDGSDSEKETSVEISVIHGGKSYGAANVPLEIFTRNAEEMHSKPDKGCYNSICVAGKKSASTTKKTRKVFLQLKNRLKLALRR